MGRSLRGALVLVTFVLAIVGCGDNDKSSYNQNGYNGQGMPPQGTGPATAPAPNTPTPVNPQYDPNDYRQDPSGNGTGQLYPPQQPLVPGGTYTPGPGPQPIPGMNNPVASGPPGPQPNQPEFVNPTVQTITPYFTGLRCPVTNAVIFNEAEAAEEASWIIAHRISFRLYHDTLSYIRRMRIVDNRNYYWAFPGRSSVMLTRQILTLRPNFDLCEFDRQYRCALRQGECGIEAVRIALHRMDRCFHTVTVYRVYR